MVFYHQRNFEDLESQRYLETGWILVELRHVAFLEVSPVVRTTT
jgi:hypothetical protein